MLTIKQTLLMLPFLLIAQSGYSLADSTAVQIPDSVKIPLKAVYYYNAVADSLDWCNQDKDLLIQAIDLGQTTIAQRDDAIRLLKFDIVEYGILDRNNQEIIREYRAQVGTERRKGWLKLLIGIGAGALGYSILK